MSDRVQVKLNVNGSNYKVDVPPMKRLLDVLREECRLTGTKEGCGEGECGACTVLIDGISVNSCLVPVFQADGARVVTVEGLAKGNKLSLLQQAFVEMGGSQCGICTPGILVSAYELLEQSPGRVPSEDVVREALAGNLCRCTGYQKIVDAVRAAASAARRAPARPATTRAAATAGRVLARARKSGVGRVAKAVAVGAARARKSGVGRVAKVVAVGTVRAALRGAIGRAAVKRAAAKRDGARRTSRPAKSTSKRGGRG